MYNLAIFTSSFLYFSVEVGAMAMGIVIVSIMACGGGNSGFRGKIS